MSLLLQAAPAAAQDTLGGYGNILFLALIFVVFYFFMIRPQTKKAKAQKNFREGIKKGDRVVTIGGVHGKIVDSDETTFILELHDQQKIKVEKAAISMESSMALADKKS